MNKALLVRGFLVLGIIWVVVWGLTTWTGIRKASPERVESLIEAADFEDLSGDNPPSISDSRKGEREAALREISDVLNRLDLRQREQLRDSDVSSDFFYRLSRDERILFVDLTFTKSLERIFSSLDEMEPDEREKMIERSTQSMTEGKDAEDLAKLKEVDPEIFEKLTQKGFQAYYQEASADTKMALRPLMDAVGEVVQGFAKPQGGGL